MKGLKRKFISALALTGVAFFVAGCGNKDDITKITTKTTTNKTTGGTTTTGDIIPITTTGKITTTGVTTKATNSFTTALTCSGITYGGTLAPNAAASHGTVTYKYSTTENGTYLTTVPTAVGTYFVKAYVAEDTTYKALESSAVSFTISKATNSFTTALTCSGIAFGGTLAPNAVAAHGEVTYMYSTTEDGTYTATAPTAIGTYYVKAYVAGDDSYNDLESSAVSFNISNKLTNSLTTALTCSGITFGGTLTPNAVASHGTVTYKYSTTEKGTYTTTVPTEGGTYYVKAYVAEDATYIAFESSAVSFTISKATNSFTTALTCSDITVGGTLAPNAVSKYGTVIYKYSTSITGTFTTTVPTEAGTYFVKAYVDETTSYSELISTSVQFTISLETKVDNVLTTALSCENILVGATPDPNAKVAHGLLVYKYSTTENGTYTTTIPTVVGTYYVKVYVAGDSTYNAFISDAVEFDINALPTKDDNSFTTALTCSDITYGETLAPSAVATDGDVYFKYCKTENGTYTSSVPTNAGTYYVKAYVDETEDYNALESSAVSFTIGKASFEQFKIDYPGEFVNLGAFYNANYKDKLGEVGIPSGWSFVLPTSTLVGDATEEDVYNEFAVVYTPTDSNYLGTTGTVNIKVAKLMGINAPDYVTNDYVYHVDYGKTFGDIKLSVGWSFVEHTADESVGNVDTIVTPIIFTSANPNYETTSFGFTIYIDKIEGTIPEEDELKNLYIVEVGSQIADLNLPSSWHFVNDDYSSSVVSKSENDVFEFDMEYFIDNNHETVPGTLRVVVTNQIIDVSLYNAPTKINYFVGDNIDLAGLEIKVSYYDGTFEYVSYDDAPTVFSYTDNALSTSDSTFSVNYKLKNKSYESLGDTCGNEYLTNSISFNIVVVEDTYELNGVTANSVSVNNYYAHEAFIPNLNIELDYVDGEDNTTYQYAYSNQLGSAVTYSIKVGENDPVNIAYGDIIPESMIGENVVINCTYLGYSFTFDSSFAININANPIVNGYIDGYSILAYYSDSTIDFSIIEVNGARQHEIGSHILSTDQYKFDIDLGDGDVTYAIPTIQEIITANSIAEGSSTSVDVKILNLENTEIGSFSIEVYNITKKESLISSMSSYFEDEESYSYFPSTTDEYDFVYNVTRKDSGKLFINNSSNNITGVSLGVCTEETFEDISYADDDDLCVDLNYIGDKIEFTMQVEFNGEVIYLKCCIPEKMSLVKSLIINDTDYTNKIDAFSSDNRINVEMDFHSITSANINAILADGYYLGYDNKGELVPVSSFDFTENDKDDSVVIYLEIYKVVDGVNNTVGSIFINFVMPYDFSKITINGADYDLCEDITLYDTLESNTIVLTPKEPNLAYEIYDSNDNIVDLDNVALFGGYNQFYIRTANGDGFDSRSFVINVTTENPYDFISDLYFGINIDYSAFIFNNNGNYQYVDEFLSAGIKDIEFMLNDGVSVEMLGNKEWKNGDGFDFVRGKNQLIFKFTINENNLYVKYVVYGDAVMINSECNLEIKVGGYETNNSSNDVLTYVVPNGVQITSDDIALVDTFGDQYSIVSTVSGDSAKVEVFQDNVYFGMYYIVIEREGELSSEISFKAGIVSQLEQLMLSQTGSSEEMAQYIITQDDFIYDEILEEYACNVGTKYYSSCAMIQNDDPYGSITLGECINVVEGSNGLLINGANGEMFKIAFTITSSDGTATRKYVAYGVIDGRKLIENNVLDSDDNVLNKTLYYIDLNPEGILISSGFNEDETRCFGIDTSFTYTEDSVVKMNLDISTQDGIYCYKVLDSTTGTLSSISSGVNVIDFDEDGYAYVVYSPISGVTSMGQIMEVIVVKYVLAHYYASFQIGDMLAKYTNYEAMNEIKLNKEGTYFYCSVPTFALGDEYYDKVNKTVRVIINYDNTLIKLYSTEARLEEDLVESSDEYQTLSITGTNVVFYTMEYVDGAWVNGKPIVFSFN